MLTKQLILFVAIAITAVSAASVARDLVGGQKIPFTQTETYRSWSGRIVGGETATPGQFPFQVSLRLFGFYHFCGGSIISNRWVVSAAHCTIGLPEEYASIVTGAHHLYNDGTEYEVEEIIIHPEYDDYTLFNDITLLRTFETIEFNQFVQPISIGDGTEIGAGIPARSSGWGTIELWGPEPEYLQFLDLVTLTREDCAARHPYWWSLVLESTLCAYSNELGRGMCHGDSGGPLTANDELIGIVSWGEPCAQGRPDAFTRVSIFVPWIHDITDL